MDFTLQAIPLPLRFRLEKPMTDDELLRFCAVNEALRIERDPTGEIIVMTPAGNKTGRRNSYLIQSLANWTDADGRGVSFDSNTGFTLPNGSMRSPDAAWIESSRVEALSEDEKDRFSHICPDFIIELRSPTDRLPDLQAKMEEWIANGAQLAWLLDPQTQSATIYRPNQPPETLTHPESIEGEGPIAGFHLPLTRIWT